jgi:hypothetical protein
MGLTDEQPPFGRDPPQPHPFHPHSLDPHYGQNPTSQIPFVHKNGPESSAAPARPISPKRTSFGSHSESVLFDCAHLDQFRDSLSTLIFHIGIIIFTK